MTTRFLPSRRFHDELVAGFQPGQQLRQSNAEHTGNLGQIPKTDVFLATLDLANVGSVESTYVGEIFLRPLPRRTKLVDTLA